MKLPPSVQRLFYRYHAGRLDTDRDAALIIPTVMEEGSLDDWEWLFSTYGWESLAAWVAAHASQLSPPMERFWTLVLLGAPRETPRWEGGNARRLVPRNALPDWFPEAWR
jgi:hypothetical protein